MAKIKTSELIGPALDWAVQEIEYQRMIAEGEHVKQWVLDDHRAGAGINHYSTNWLWGGPIVEREGINIYRMTSDWSAAYNPSGATQDGPTPLIAAMRCFVASKLGDEIEVPDELLERTHHAASHTLRTPSCSRHLQKGEGCL